MNARQQPVTGMGKSATLCQHPLRGSYLASWVQRRCRWWRVAVPPTTTSGITLGTARSTGFKLCPTALVLAWQRASVAFGTTCAQHEYGMRWKDEHGSEIRKVRMTTREYGSLADAAQHVPVPWKGAGWDRSCGKHWVGEEDGYRIAGDLCTPLRASPEGPLPPAI